jgi:hypothetical protein
LGVNPSRVLWAVLTLLGRIPTGSPVQDWNTTKEDFGEKLNCGKGYGHSSMPFVDERRKFDTLKIVTDEVVGAVGPVVEEVLAADDQNMTNIRGLQRLCEWASHICEAWRAMSEGALKLGFQSIIDMKQEMTQQRNEHELDDVRAQMCVLRCACSVADEHMSRAVAALTGAQAAQTG